MFFLASNWVLKSNQKNKNTQQINKSDKGISVSINYKDIIFSKKTIIGLNQN